MGPTAESNNNRIINFCSRNCDKLPTVLSTHTKKGRKKLFIMRDNSALKLVLSVSVFAWSEFVLRGLVFDTFNDGFSFFRTARLYDLYCRQI